VGPPFVQDCPVVLELSTQRRLARRDDYDSNDVLIFLCQRKTLAIRYAEERIAFAANILFNSCYHVVVSILRDRPNRVTQV
jgi:hypothetical protein